MAADQVKNNPNSAADAIDTLETAAARFWGKLGALHVPIFTAPRGGNEFTRPTGWQFLTADGNDDRLRDLTPSGAIAAVCGGPIAIIDVDPRNGGDVDRVRALLASLNVRIFAQVATPGGGRHFYVAGHPELASAHSGRSGSLVGYPGVDIQSFGTNVFLPGTKRPKYDGLGYEVVSEDLDALADGGDPDGAEALAAWVAEHRGRPQSDLFIPADAWGGKPPDRRQTAYLLKVLSGEADKIAATPVGGRNDGLNIAAVKLGNYVAGAGLDEQTVIDTLLQAAEACGLTKDDGIAQTRATIASGLRFGKTRPRAVPDATRARPIITADTVHQANGANEGCAEPALLVPLPDLLSEPDEPVTYRIANLLPTGGRVVCAAQFKAGKTTLRDNVVRCLADGVPFLDRFEVAPLPEGATVAVIDDEMSRGQIRRWMRDQGIQHPERVQVAVLRGRVATFDLLTPETRAMWADALRAAGAAVVIFDCLRPVLDALGLDESRDAGRFLVAFDALLAEAGVDEAIVVHHMGHNGERSRGDSRIRDWPDAEWRLVRQSEPGEQADPAAPRFFSAYGRDVDIAEGTLTFDPVTRRLTFAGGNRQEARKAQKSSGLEAAVLAIIGVEPGIGANEVATALRHADERAELDGIDVPGFQDGDVKAAIRSLISAGKVSAPPPMRGRKRPLSLPVPTGSEPVPGTGRVTGSTGLIYAREPEPAPVAPVLKQTARNRIGVCEVCGLVGRPLDVAGICDRRDHSHEIGRRALGALS